MKKLIRLGVSLDHHRLEAFDRLILPVMHVRLDQHHCVEVPVVRGTSADVRAVADRLIGTKASGTAS